MTIALWAVIVFTMVSALLTIGQVGKERPQITPGVAALSTVFAAAIIIILILAINTLEGAS